MGLSLVRNGLLRSFEHELEFLADCRRFFGSEYQLEDRRYFETVFDVALQQYASSTSLFHDAFSLLW